MKFNKIITSFFSIAAASLLVAACGSNEQTAIDETGKVDPSQGLVFKIEAEEYQTVPTKSATRATGQDTQPQEIDLGNGLVAEFTIEPDTLQPEPQTRATISDGHYRIYAVNSSNQRLTGPHKSIAGTVSGGVFTPDANKSMLLDHGTYTFVCINDAVTDNGTSLEVKQDAVNAMIGTTTVAITQPRQEISFIMRHMMARIRYQITSYTTAPTNATFSMGTDAGNFGAITFDIKGVKTSQATTAYSILNAPVKPTTTVENSAIVKTYKSTTDYLYFFDGFDTGYIQVGSIKGNLYGKTFNVYPANWFINRTSVQRNHSYIFNFTIKSKDPLLLFQDGTVGYLGDKGTRTPIALVIDQRTETTDGLAIALKDAGNFNCVWSDAGAPYLKQYNSFMSTNFATQLADMNGYGWTYEPGGSIDNVAKSSVANRIGGTSSGKFIAFYDCISYNAGAPLTFSGDKRGKWFLPSMGQWQRLFQVHGKVTTVPTEFNDYGSPVPGKIKEGVCDLTSLKNIFESLGGTLPDYDMWSSTEYDNEKAVSCSFSNGLTSYSFILDSKQNTGDHARAFIHF